MMNTRRREFLTMTVGGVAAAGAAAFVPSLLFSTPTVAAAQGAAPDDPLLLEIMNQMKRHHAGLVTSPPRGNAQAIAGTHRMLAAWMKSGKFDEKMKQSVNDMVARDGHDGLIRQITSFDFAAAAKARGVTLPPNLPQFASYAQAAKAIGMVQGGFSAEREMRLRAKLIEHKADQLNRQLLIRNGRQPDATILRIQNPEGWSEGDGYTMFCEALQPDGSQICTYHFTPEPTVEEMWAQAMQNAMMVYVILAFLANYACYADWAACLGLIMVEAMWGLLLWYLSGG